MKGLDRQTGEDQPDRDPDRNPERPPVSGTSDVVPIREQNERMDRVRRAMHMEREVALPEKAREAPRAADVMPSNFHDYEVDPRKFSEYSLNPGHKQNNGKAEGWRAMGYDVDDPKARAEAAEDLTEMSRVMLSEGRVVKTDETRSARATRSCPGSSAPTARTER